MFGNKEKKNDEGDGRKIKLITLNLNKREVHISYKRWNQIMRVRFNLLNIEMYIYNLEISGRLNHGKKRYKL